MLAFTPDQVPSSVIFEAVWEPNLPDPPVDPIDGTDYWFHGSQGDQRILSHFCSSPCYARDDESAARMQAGVEATVQLDGPVAWIAANQEFDIYATVFYNGAAPDRWSLVNGDESS
jgi:hypothetical protein